jgi:hypothetical protein
MAARMKTDAEYAEEERKLQVKLQNIAKKRFAAKVEGELRELNLPDVFKKIKVAISGVTDDIIIDVIKELVKEKKPVKPKTPEQLKKAAEAAKKAAAKRKADKLAKEAAK